MEREAGPLKHPADGREPPQSGADMIDAMNRCLETVRRRPGDHEAWNRLGEILTRLDRTEEAEQCFRKSISIRDDRGASIANRVNLLRAGDSYRAEIDFDEFSSTQVIGERRFCTLKIRNVGTRGWHPFEKGPDQPQVGIVLLDRHRNPLKEIGIHPMPRTVLPGEEITLEVPVGIVCLPGEYYIKVDLFIKNVAWFESLGSRPFIRKMRLLDGPTPITSLLIELTNICNFDCLFCPNEAMKRKKGIMDEVTFRKIIDELAAMGFENPVGFHVMGEPLLHPRFFEFVEYAERKNIDIELHTNGMPLNDDVLERIYRQKNIVRFWISYHTPTEDSFLRLRRPLKSNRENLFSDYTDRVKRAIRKKIETGSDTELRVYLMATHCSVEFDVVNDSRYAKKLLQHWYRYAEEIEREYGISYAREPIPENLLDGLPSKELYPIFDKTYIRFVPCHVWGGTFRSDYRRSVECRNPWFQFAVLWNGDCTPCCLDYDGDLNLGNIHDRSIREIWAEDKIEKIRQGFVHGQVLEERCRRCFS